MTKHHQRARAAGRRIFRWLVRAEGLASVAAGNGEPAPLLALEVCQRVHRSVEERPGHPDGVDAADPIPGSVRPRGVEKPMTRHPAHERSER
jgi:hypothetical protein